SSPKGGIKSPRGTVLTKSLSLHSLWLLNPPLKKGEIGGFALGRLGKIPPHPPLQRGGNTIYGYALRPPSDLVQNSGNTFAIVPRVRSSRNNIPSPRGRGVR